MTTTITGAGQRREALTAAAAASAPRGAPRRRLVDRVADAPRVVVGEGPHAQPRPVDEAAPRRVERVDHRQQHIAGDALVCNPVPMSTRAGELVRAVDAGHVDAHQALVASQRLQILARELVEARATQP